LREYRGEVPGCPGGVGAYVPPGCSLHAFQSLAVDDVVAAVRALPDKQSADDPVPTRLLKENVDVLAPFLVELHNRSLQTGSVPTSFKSAYITPLLKKANFDPSSHRRRYSGRYGSHQENKYATLSSAYRFEPIAVENLGVFSSTTLNFISELGRRICFPSSKV